jgi:hypothetical protein
MSEQNILNPNAASELTPDYSYSEGLPQMMSQFQAKSGKVYARQLMARGRAYDLAWGSRLKAIADQLRQWEAQYRNDFFSYQDLERARYFSGRFAAPLQISPSGNNKWDIRGQFVEIPGLAMFAYPATWGTDSIFLEERDGFGSDLVKLTGAGWTLEVTANAHSGTDYFSNVTNATAEWIYFGYGFRFWSRTQSNLGKVEISLDGTIVSAALDLYTAGATASSVLFTQTNTPLGLHRVKLRVTGTKNAASSDFYCYADAIEAMQ